jgi:hypothetical protein
MFVMDRSGSMCYDTSNLTYYGSPSADGPMAKSPTGWYWMPRYIYREDAWRTAWFYATDDTTGEVVTSFLPAHVTSRLTDGVYFRYCSRDNPDTVQSGFLYAPSNVTIHSRYGSAYPYWSAQSYGPISSCDYAVANDPIQPIGSSQVAASAFVDLLDPTRDRAGLVTYAWDATLDHPLTDDWAGLKATMAAYDPRGSTATPVGMKVGNDEFILSGRAGSYGQRIMILLTDGLANVASSGGGYYDNGNHTVTFFGQSVSCQIHPTVAAAMEAQVERAINNGINIYTVSFGAGADQALMPLIAAKANGAYYYAADHEDLSAVFVDIFHRLPAILTM